jgi:hypothetical protein
MSQRGLGKGASRLCEEGLRAFPDMGRSGDQALRGVSRQPMLLPLTSDRDGCS